jgi:hypothetical protein
MRRKGEDVYEGLGVTMLRAFPVNGWDLPRLSILGS